MKAIKTICSICLLLLVAASHAQTNPVNDSIAKQDAKMKWWREARFGMFIHWGLYALPAGEWNGKEVPGISEWIMYRAKIPVQQYEQLTTQFNPVKFNAEEWVKMAKYAGMKYIVITSKHHDGFAMFHSKASKYNIYDATSFKRDPLQELAAACKKYGIRLGFYYSEAQDWHEPGGTFAGIDRGTPYWDSTVKREPLMNYIDGKSVPQVQEILENYGGLNVLWWDTPDGMTEEAAKKLKAVTDKYPNLITNDRLLRGWRGDFTTPEQYVPPTGLNYDWEVCMTMNTSWGYKKMDSAWKSSQDLVRMLTDIASKGGNLLLNVGPTAEGSFPAPSIERLQQIGDWMQKNSESIYGTSASPFFKLSWGRSTIKKGANGNILYLNVFNMPEDGIIRVPGLNTEVKDIYTLADKKHKLKGRFESGDLIIDAKGVQPDPYSTVIAIATGKVMEVTSNKPALKNGTVSLTADFADIHNVGYGRQAALVYKNTEPVIENWVDSRAYMEWIFSVPEGAEGKYRVLVMAKAPKGGQATIRLGQDNSSASTISTSENFTNTDLGIIEVKKAGDQVISLRPVRDNWSGIELKGIKLVKQP